MITLEYLTDNNDIKNSLRQDNIYKEVLGLETMDNFNPDKLTTCWFLIKDNNQNVGVFVGRDVSSNCIAIHGGLYKEYRGKNTVQISKDCIKILRTLVNCELISTVNSSNIPAVKLLEKLGFTLKTTIKNGCLTGDLLIYGDYNG